MVPEDPLLADWQSSETAVKKPWSLYQSTPKSTTRNKTFLIESNEEPPVCPCCGGKLFLRDHRRRHGKTYQGEVVTFLIPRLKCSRCKRLHNALPDCLVPHKHYVSEVIENVIDEVSTSEDETTGYTGAVKPPVRRTGNRKSGPEETGIYAAVPPSRRNSFPGWGRQLIGYIIRSVPDPVRIPLSWSGSWKDRSERC